MLPPLEVDDSLEYFRILERSSRGLLYKESRKSQKVFTKNTKSILYNLYSSFRNIFHAICISPWTSRRTPFRWVASHEAGLSEDEKSPPLKIWKYGRRYDFYRSDRVLSRDDGWEDSYLQSTCLEDPAEAMSQIPLRSIRDLTPHEVLGMSGEVCLLSHIWVTPEELYHGWACGPACRGKCFRSSTPSPKSSSFTRNHGKCHHEVWYSCHMRDMERIPKGVSGRLYPSDIWCAYDIYRPSTIPRIHRDLRWHVRTIQSEEVIRDAGICDSRRSQEAQWNIWKSSDRYRNRDTTWLGHYRRDRPSAALWSDTSRDRISDDNRLYQWTE